MEKVSLQEAGGPRGRIESASRSRIVCVIIRGMVALSGVAVSTRVGE